MAVAAGTPIVVEMAILNRPQTCVRVKAFRWMASSFPAEGTGAKRATTTAGSPRRRQRQSCNRSSGGAILGRVLGAWRQGHLIGAAGGARRGRSWRPVTQPSSTASCRRYHYCHAHQPPRPPKLSSVIEVERYKKLYGDFVAVHDLRLWCTRRVLGLVGPNGAGKTTTLRALAAFCSHAGNIRICGIDRSVSPVTASTIGFYPDERNC